MELGRESAYRFGDSRRRQRQQAPDDLLGGQLKFVVITRLFLADRVHRDHDPRPRSALRVLDTVPIIFTEERLHPVILVNAMSRELHVEISFAAAQKHSHSTPLLRRQEVARYPITPAAYASGAED